MYIDIEEVLWRKIEKQPTRWNEISVNFRGKVGHYRNGSLCYCFSLVGQHLYISSARKFNEVPKPTRLGIFLCYLVIQQVKVKDYNKNDRYVGVYDLKSYKR